MNWDVHLRGYITNEALSILKADLGRSNINVAEPRILWCRMKV